MSKNRNIGLKYFECGLMTLYRNPVIVILVSLPALIVSFITAYILLDNYSSWTASGSAVSMTNPYQSVIYGIARIGKYIFPMTYILIPAAYALSDLQGGIMMKCLPIDRKTRFAYSILQMSLLVVLSILLTYLAFLLCVKAIGAYRPLLDLHNYGTHDDVAVFFANILIIALLIVLTQLVMHLLTGNIWVPLAIGAILMAVPFPENYNIYSDGVTWAWQGFFNGIEFMSRCALSPIFTLFCILIVLIIVLIWKRR